jgi:2,3-bisphosphoglycerate-dependent phosphoglycerate mutase
MSALILVRHGQSEWNEKNLFTGWKDPDLTSKGEEEAKEAGKSLNNLDIKYDLMFTSILLRAKRTAQIILNELNQRDIKIIKDKALNERDYGNLSGLNKDEAREKWGEEKVHKWRRSYNTPPPDGESLKDTAERVLPYYRNKILPHVNEGKNIIVAAHGNSLRALVMELDNLSPKEIVKLEIPTGIPIFYEISSSGSIESKKIL